LVSVFPAVVDECSALLSPAVSILPHGLYTLQQYSSSVN